MGAGYLMLQYRVTNAPTMATTNHATAHAGLPRASSKRVKPAAPSDAKPDQSWRLIASGAPNDRLDLRQLEGFWEVGVHVVPWLSTRGVDVAAGLKLARVIEAADSNGHDVRPGAGLAKETRSALGAEGSAGRLPTVRRELEVLGAPSRQREGRLEHGQNWGKGTASFSLTVPAVTIEGEEWFRRALVANRTTGTSTGQRTRHRAILRHWSPRYRRTEMFHASF